MERTQRPIRDNRREEIEELRIPIPDLPDNPRTPTPNISGNFREEIERLMPPDFFDSEGQLREDLLNSHKVTVDLTPDQRVLEVTLTPDHPGGEIERLRIPIRPVANGNPQIIKCMEEFNYDILLMLQCFLKVEAENS